MQIRKVVVAHNARIFGCVLRRHMEVREDRKELENSLDQTRLDETTAGSRARARRSAEALCGASRSDIQLGDPHPTFEIFLGTQVSVGTMARNRFAQVSDSMQVLE